MEVRAKPIEIIQVSAADLPENIEVLNTPV